MKISETLYKAAEHIEVHGWYQGYFWPHEGLGDPPYTQGDPCCALGAISVVEDSDPVQHDTPAMRELADYLGAKDPLGGSAPVAEWNDTPLRTKEEVLAALRGAALRAERAGK